jgi:cytoskeletal protein RodZ
MNSKKPLFLFLFSFLIACFFFYLLISFFFLHLFLLVYSLMIEENIRERVEAEKEVRESIHANTVAQSPRNKSPKKNDPKTSSCDGSLKSASNDNNEEGGLSISTSTYVVDVNTSSPPTSPQAPLGSPGLSPKISRSNFRLHLTGEDNIERLTNITKTASLSPAHKSPSTNRKQLDDTAVVNPMVIPGSPGKSPSATENSEKQDK